MVSKKLVFHIGCATALALAAGGLDAAPAADQSWPPAKWPSAVSDPVLQDRLAHTDFTAEEKQAILQAVNGQSEDVRAVRLQDPNRAAQRAAQEKRREAAKAAQPPDLFGTMQGTLGPDGLIINRPGFGGLDAYYGVHDYDGTVSVSDRVNRIEDLIAKGKRVWRVFKIYGHHDGMMYGFKGDGKAVDMREMSYDGVFRADELQIYTQLGGKVQFSKNAAAIRAASLKTPGGTAPAGLVPYAPNPLWADWPPAQWPSDVRNPKLIKTLTGTDWSAEEKRNLQTTMENLVFSPSDPAVNPPISSSAATLAVIKHRAFDGLNELAGFYGYNAAVSVPDRGNEIESILAKGNRVWVIYLSRGHRMGPFFGFAGTGKPIEWREIAFFDYDKDGNIASETVRSEEMQLYAALGGKFHFPGKKATP